MTLALGVMLAFRYLRSSGGRLPLAGIVHGLAGASGLALLIGALQGPRRGDAMGVGSFGTAAATLFGIALTLGLLIPLLANRSTRVAGVIIAAHATIAVTAFVLLLAWASIGQAAP